MKRIISLLLVMMLATATFSACSILQRNLSADELLDLGEKYLLELDYEQALVQFEKAIEVEPMNPRAYISAADTYVRLERIDDAIEVLELGYEHTQDETIRARIEELKPTEDELAVEYGNTPGNINNDDSIAIVGDWTYNTDRSSICRTNIDGTEQIIVSKENGSIRNINVVGDWIYYIKTDGSKCQYQEDMDLEQFGMFKMRTDGTERKKITGSGYYQGHDGMYCSTVTGINVIGDWIYYIEDQGIYKIHTDGTGKKSITEALSSRQISGLNIVDDWIFFATRSGTGFDIRKIKTDGTNETSITKVGLPWIGGSNFIYRIIITDGWIYFHHTEDNGSGEIVRLDGTGEYKIRLDGTECQRID